MHPADHEHRARHGRGHQGDHQQHGSGPQLGASPEGVGHLVAQPAGESPGRTGARLAQVSSHRRDDRRLGQRGALVGFVRVVDAAQPGLLELATEQLETATGCGSDLLL